MRRVLFLVFGLGASFVGFGALRGAPAGTPAEPKQITLRLSDARFFLGVPPAGWHAPGFDDRRWGGPAPGPFAARTPTGTPPTTTPAGTTLDGVPRGALLLRRMFEIDGDLARVRALELRVTYADGFVAYLNGREVARRGIPTGALDPASALPDLRATNSHGGEVERVTIAIPSGAGGAAAVGLKPRANVLALAIVPSGAGSLLAPAAPAGNFALAAFSGVRIVRGPYLLAPSEDNHRAALLVAWETDLPATGTISVEPVEPAAGEKPREVRSGAAASRHVVKLSRLQPGRRYRYRLRVTAATGDVDQRGPFELHTLPPPTQPARFAVYGDMRAPGHAAHAEVVAALVREAPALVLNTGDLTAHGSEESNWQRYFEITAPLGAIAPVVPALGNHDASRGGLGSPKTWQLFGLKTASPANLSPGWASFDLADVHFIILDSNQTTVPAQQTWLAQDLARLRRKRPRPRAIFAFCHEGPWANGPHGGSAAMIRDYAPRLAAAGVDVIFSGHDHLYERGVGATEAGPLNYVVTGGGGAPLYNPTCQPAAGGPLKDVPGPLSPCPPSVAAMVKTYHYVMVEVRDKEIALCPKRPDGSPIEACTLYPRRR